MQKYEYLMINMNYGTHLWHHASCQLLHILLFFNISFQVVLTKLLYFHDYVLNPQMLMEAMNQE